MKELFTEIEIRADAGRVWRLLTEFDKFPEWNPFLRRASGRIAEEKSSRYSCDIPVRAW